MKKQLPIGTSDYKKLIDNNYYYVDKTLFIDDILKYGGEVVLIPRPRRFGKTLNMSMLKYYFEKTEQSNAHLFEDKKIWQLPERAALQGKFPVIFVTFKDIKEDTWQITKNKLIAVIAAEYTRHQYLLESNQLNEHEKKTFDNIRAKKANDEEYHDSLKKLSEYLYRFYQVKPFVLLDEYDAPIHAGFLHAYYSEVLQFVRGLMSGVFKDNNYLERGVITGILHIVKEDIFSGLNNLIVVTLLSDRMNDKFGFTQQEVDQLLHEYNLFNINQKFKDWYNGYLIGAGYVMGSVKIYNPWSALNCVYNNGFFQPYWVNSSDNKLIYNVIAHSTFKIKEACADLMLGNIVKNIEIADYTALPLLHTNYDASNKQDYKEEIDAKQHANAIWSLLLFSGYVTPHAFHLDGDEIHADLKIPNEELRRLFTKFLKQLFHQNIKSIDAKTLYEALQNANGEAFSKIISKHVAQSMSYYDISVKEPEKSYHLFILGLLVVLAEKYQVQSNRESGDGRFDIMLIPLDKNNPGIVIEFKKKNDIENLSECADRALEQIKERNYAAQLVQQGVKKIVAFGIAVFKKEVLLRQEELSN